MDRDFHQVAWDETLRTELAEILRLAVWEDLQDEGDWTSRALVPEGVRGTAAVVARQPGVVAGLPAGEMALAAIDPRLHWLPEAQDGQIVGQGDRLAVIDGPARSLLTAERLVLNLLGRLAGVATLTRRYVEMVAGTKARIYDTRKTTPGWRRLEKYAVRCGGGCNHRTGLFEAVLIKDNHLALGAQPATKENVPPVRFTAAEAVQRARQYVAQQAPQTGRQRIIEVEVDTLEQLAEVLPASPDIVLLDNMHPPQLFEAVRLARCPGAAGRVGSVRRGEPGNGPGDCPVRGRADQRRRADTLRRLVGRGPRLALVRCGDRECRIQVEGRLSGFG